MSYTCRMKKQHVQLKPKERIQLNEMTSTGHLSGRVYKRAIALLELDRGKTYVAVSETLDISPLTLATLAQKYQAGGLDCLYDKPRPGRPTVFDGQDRAKITALACSEPPEGHGQWTLRLLADKAVELEYVEQISHMEVSRILKKTNSSRT